MLDSILPTPVKLTHSEILFSAAATLAFQVIEEGGRPIIRLSRLCEKPQYGYTASAQAERVGPRFLRITDIKAGRVDWKNVPYCDCPEPEKYLLKPGDILVARSGSVGKSFLVSECPEPTVFASYMIRMRAKPGVLAGYVYWYLQTQQFWFQIKEGKRGSAMKNINSKMLSSSRIPDATPSQQKAVVSFLIWFQNRIDGDYKTPPPEVPELLDVPRIVARIEELAALIEEAHGLRVKAREEAEALQKSMFQSVFGEGMRQPNEWPTLSTMVERIENGWSPACLPFPADEDEWGVLKVGAVSTGQFVPNENKALPPHLEPRPEFEIRHDDFLFGRANTRELVGACTVVQNPPKRLLLCDKIFRFVFKPNVQLDKFYLNFALKSPALREQIEAVASGTSSSMKNISKAKVMRLRVPLPHLAEQRRIVAYLDGLQAQVDELTALQDATQAELGALLPSVLDRAFRGEL